MADCGECGGLERLNRELEAVREDVDRRHSENREDIDRRHEENKREQAELRRRQEDMATDLSGLRGQIKPYFDNGQPGLITKMSEKLDELLLAYASQRGTKKASSKLLDKWLAPLIVGLALVLAQHFWK